MDQLTVWVVTAGGKRAVFDDMDVAMVYLRALFRKGGLDMASLESEIWDRADYLAVVEVEDGDSPDA